MSDLDLYDPARTAGRLKVNGSPLAHLAVGSELPATCELGDVFVLTSGDVGLWVCASIPNIWQKTGQVGPVLFLHDDADGVISNYTKLLIVPTGGGEATLTAAVTSGGGALQMGVSGTPKAFVTEAGYPGASLILGGTWDFSLYAKVSSIAGSTSTITANVYKRAVNDAETLLFSASADITSTAIALYEILSTQPDIVIDSADRLVLKLVGSTTAAQSRTLTLYFEGTSHYSHFHVPPFGI